MNSEADNFIPEEEHFNLLSNLAVAARLFANDLKHMHVHCVGEKFQEMHETLKGYYEEAENEADFFSEYGIINNESISNPSVALSKVNANWEPESKEMFEYEDYLSSLWTKGNLYISMVEDISDKYTDVVYSVVDDFLKFWYTEIKYKLASQNIIALQQIDYEAEEEPYEEEISLAGMFQENYKDI